MFIKKFDEDNFHFVMINHTDGVAKSIVEFSGKIGDEESYRSTERQLNEKDSAHYTESYAGHDDPRLPEDVASLPIGRREDFVSTFNSYFYYYYKSEDEDYDENESRTKNAIRYALAKAYAAIEEEKDAGVSESVNNDGTVRIRETYYGVDPRSFKETKGGGFSNEITVLEKGWSLNGNYYGKKVLPQLAEGCKNMVVGYFNHGDTFDRDPRDWAIVTESGAVRGDSVTANIHVFQYPDGDMLKERIEYAKEKEAPHLFGVSIDAFARISEGEAEGREGTIIEEIVRLNSVDIVMIPAAGGGFETQESAKKPIQTTPTNEKEKVVMDVKTLKAEHPDTAKLLIEEGRAAVVDEYAAKEADAQTAIEAKDAEIAELKEGKAKAEAKVDEYELAAKQETFKAEVVALIESELPEDKRSDKFTDICLKLGPDQMDSIKEMVAERKESKVTAVIEGEGAGEIEAKDENKDQETEKVTESEEDRLAAFKKSLNK